VPLPSAENDPLIALAGAYSAHIGATNKLWTTCFGFTIAIIATLLTKDGDKFDFIGVPLTKESLLIVATISLLGAYFAFTVSQINQWKVGKMFVRAAEECAPFHIGSRIYVAPDYYHAFVKGSINRVAPFFFTEGAPYAERSSSFEYTKRAVDLVQIGIPAAGILLAAVNLIPTESNIPVLTAVTCGPFSLVLLYFLYDGAKDWAKWASAVNRDVTVINVPKD